MENQEVTVYLNTPLMRLEPKGGEVEENTNRVRGKVTSHDDSGITMNVKALGTDRSWNKELEILKKIFIPHHKIDYVLLD